MQLSRRETSVGAAILFVLTAVVFAPFLFGDRNLMSSAVNAGSIYAAGAAAAPPSRYLASGRTLDAGAAAWQTEPEFVLEHQLISHGDPPLWNPYVGFGEPLAANMISQPYYPLTWIVQVNPSPRGYSWYVALRLWAGGFFAFLFLGYFVRFPAALAGGIAFAFTGYLVVYYDDPNISSEVVVPALLAAVERLLRARDWSSVGVLGLVSGVTVLGGMPECAFLGFAFAIAYAVVRVLADRDLRSRSRAITGRMAAGFALGAAVSAIAAVPFLEFVRFSLNQHIGFGARGLPIGLTGDAWDPRKVAQYVAPLLYGPPWSSAMTTESWIRGYWGVAATFFALVAVFSRAHERLANRDAKWSPETFFAVVAAILLLKRFSVPAVQWIGALPVFGLVVYQRYEELEIGLCIAVLAAFGIERILSGRASRAAIVASGATILTVLTVGAASVKEQFRALPAQQAYLVNALAWALAALGSMMVFAWWTRRATWVRYAGAGAVLLLGVDLIGCFLVPVWYVINEPPRTDLNPENGAPYVAYLQRETERTHERFLGLDGLLYPEWSAAFGILDVRDLNPLYVREYLPFVRTFLTQNDASRAELVDRFSGTTLRWPADPLARRFLALGSVRYLATTHQPPPAAAGRASPFSAAFEAPDAHVLSFRDPLPRLALYGRVSGAADDEAALRLLASPQHDIGSVAVVTLRDSAARGVVSDLQGAAPQPVGAGILERYDSRTVVGTVDARATSLAVLNDTDYPGWRATVDGRPVAIVRANGMFRGVEVQPGRHRIEYRYEPASFAIGRMVTFIGLVIVAVLLLAPPLRRARMARRASPA